MLAHPDTVFIDEGVDFLDPQLYSACRAQFGMATVLPRRAYTSEVFQRLENEKVWTRDWVCIGTAPEIASPLDLLPYTIGQHAIHVQRSADGGLIGRFNKAQHGGCRTIPAQCRTGKKTKCSYNSCGFSRDREVIYGESLTEMTPQMGQYLGAIPERLLPVKIRTCGPLIFANIDPTRGTNSPCSVRNGPRIWCVWKATGRTPGELEAGGGGHRRRGAFPPAAAAAPPTTSAPNGRSPISC